MENQFAKKINFLPVTLIVLMLGVSILGMLRLYSLGEEAMSEATMAEKKAMSLAIDPTLPYDCNVISSSQYQAIGNIVSSDGEILYGAAKRSAGSAFFNLIGEMNSDSANYVASAYKEQLQNEYSMWSGLSVDTDSNLTLTLNSFLQNQVHDYMQQNGIDGTAVAYDYTTGDILCMVSTPSADISDMANVNALPDGALLNKNLHTTVPGSTMKVVTLILAQMQGVDVSQFSYTCEKTYSLKQGGKIVCTGKHGRIDVEEALGKSCNCYFAQLVEKNINLEQASKDLKQLGFVLEENTSGNLGLLNCKVSSTYLTSKKEFDTVWAFLGQGKTMVNPIFMCQIAGAIAGKTDAKVPHLLQDEDIASCELLNLIDVKAIEQIWEKAFSNHYDLKTYGDKITAAKTGTAQLAQGREQKTLMGYSETLHVAFYIVVENYLDGTGEQLHVLPVDVAKYLLDTWSEVQ